jgi:hypothetical protein
MGCNGPAAPENTVKKPCRDGLMLEVTGDMVQEGCQEPSLQMSETRKVSIRAGFLYTEPHFL